MAYEIPFTDSTNKGTITVEDNAINTETSLKLPGRNLKDYGTSVLTNFIQLLENFANVNPPSNPVEGQLWYDNTTGVDQLKLYDGTNWVAAGGLKKANSEPEGSNSVTGDLWVDTSNNQLYLYSGSGWILVGPSYSDGVKTGAIPETIVDTGNVQRLCVVNYCNDVIVSIISGATFTPKVSLSGFSQIKAGINISTNISGSVGKLNGTAERAENLIVSGAVVPSTSFMRNDEPAITSYQLSVRSNDGIQVGESRALNLLVEGTSSVIDHALTGSSLDLRVNNAGTSQTAIRIKSDTTVGINNLNPSESLDVIGNAKISGVIYANDTTDTVSPVTGALIVKGGVGITKQLQVGDNVTIQGNITAEDLIPDVNGVRNIGTSIKAYDNLYANRITGNLTGNVTGNVSGTAGSTSKLTTATTFAMSGDVSSSGFSFDGQTGGSTKTFVTSIDSTFISGKTDAGAISTTDEILINRPGTGFLKTTQASFIGSIPGTPIGTVVMYAGFTAPDGWFLCDGSEKALATYSVLAAALGYDPLDVTTWYWGNPSVPTTLFRIPDFRGRVAAGLGAASGSNRITNSAIGTMGGVGGNPTVTLSDANLPDHTHDLQSSTGEQFYVTTTATASAPEVTASNGDTAGTGTRLDNSGGITGGATTSPVDIQNPFASINFIIYHGVHS